MLIKAYFEEKKTTISDISGQSLTKHYMKMWLPRQQEKVYVSSFAFKTSPIIFLVIFTRFNFKKKRLCCFGVMPQKLQLGRKQPRFLSG